MKKLKFCSVLYKMKMNKHSSCMFVLFFMFAFIFWIRRQNFIVIFKDNSKHILMFPNTDGKIYTFIDLIDINILQQTKMCLNLHMGILFREIYSICKVWPFFKCMISLIQLNCGNCYINKKIYNIKMRLEVKIKLWKREWMVNC